MEFYLIPCQVIIPLLEYDFSLGLRRSYISPYFYGVSHIIASLC